MNEDEIDNSDLMSAEEQRDIIDQEIERLDVARNEPTQSTQRIIPPERFKDAAEEDLRQSKAIDDLGKLGINFNDMLMQMQEMQMTIEEDDDDLPAGHTDIGRPDVVEDHGIELQDDTSLDYDRFKILQSGAASIKVYVGNWTRNGILAQLTCDVGESFKTLTGFSASTTYDVYVQLDNNLYPTALTAGFGAAPITAETFGINAFYIIGQVSTDGSGNVTSVSQFHLGDIDDTANYWDNLSTWYNVSYQTELKGWATASAVTVDALHLFPAQRPTTRDLDYLLWDDIVKNLTNANSIVNAVNDYATIAITNIDITDADHSK